MKKTRIHLSQPFEEILATVLSLPGAQDDVFDDTANGNLELKQVLRGLYEAANGRQVETALGLVTIAPAVAPFLREAPFEVETQLDFFVEAMSRVITCPSDLTNPAGVSGMIGSGNGQCAPLRANVPVKEQEIFSPFIPERDRLALPPQGVFHG